MQACVSLCHIGTHKFICLLTQMYYTVTKLMLYFLNIITRKHIKYSYAVHCKILLMAKQIIALYVLLSNSIMNLLNLH
jgi:hypothetical protein